MCVFMKERQKNGSWTQGRVHGLRQKRRDECARGSQRERWKEGRKGESETEGQ